MIICLNLSDSEAEYLYKYYADMEGLKMSPKLEAVRCKYILTYELKMKEQKAILDSLPELEK